MYTMSRFPPIPPSELSPEQKVLHDEIDVGTQKEFGKSFQMKNSEGALLGPMAPLLYKRSTSTPFPVPKLTLWQLHPFTRQLMVWLKSRRHGTD
jgi:hypothetical protein